MVAFRLPLPVSANVLVRPALLSSMRCEACGSSPTKRPIVRLVSTAEAKEFREAAHRCLPVAPQPGPVEVYATFYVGTLSVDCDNRIKSLLDAMKGRLFFDDVQVAELHVVKVVTPDDSKHGVVVEVRQSAPGDHPELARRLAASSVQQRANDAAQPQLFTNATGKQEVSTERDGSTPPADTPGNAPMRGGGGVGPPRPRAVPGESQLERIVRLAKPAVISPNKPDDEGPEAA